MVKRLISLTFLGLAAMMPTSAASNTFEIKDEKRHVELIGVVRGWVVDEVAAKIDLLSKKSPKPITMLINSPGGAVAPGTSVVDSMRLAKKRGVRFKCLSGVLSASMAFIILAHCDERYVLSDTKLLFHPMSIGMGRARIMEVLPVLEQYRVEEQKIMRFLQQTMGLKWRHFHMHYFAETFWTGTGLSEHAKGFLKITDDVRNVKNLFKYRRPGRSPFGQIQADAIPAQTKEILKRFEGGE